MRRPPSSLATACTAVLLAALGGQCGSPPGNPGTSPPSPSSETPLAGQSDPAWFRDITEASGLEFLHDAGPLGDFFFPEIMAGGAALLDFDADGDLDIYLVNGGDRRPGSSQAEAPGSPAPVNRLYRQDAEGRFQDVTKGSGLDDPGYGMGVAVGDVNNDGLPDVYVSNYGPDRLFLNRGGGKFEDITEQAGIDNANWGASVCFVDFDRDGWLDLFVTNYVDYDPSRPCIDGRGVQDYCNPQVFPGTADRLFHNRSGNFVAAGEGPEGQTARVKFQDVSLSSGIALQTGAGLGVVCLDANEDGWPDIYVANDGQANRLWINQRDGTFRDEAILQGVAYDVLGVGQASMGIALGDVDGDQRFDMLLTHLDGENNALYTSGGRLFRESSARWGVAGASFPYTGFGTAMGDFDSDGDLDLAVVNGRVILPRGHRGTSGPAEEFFRPYAERNQVFENEGERLRLRESAGDDFGRPTEVSRALATGDVDNDGRLDLLVSNIGGPARLYHNVAQAAGSWLMLRVVEPRHGNRDAYGATVTVRAGNRQWIRLVQAGGSYLASSDPRVHFGLGDVTRVDAVEVLWPDGSRETFDGGEVNRLRVLAHGQGTGGPESSESKSGESKSGESKSSESKSSESEP